MFYRMFDLLGSKGNLYTIVVCIYIHINYYMWCFCKINPVYFNVMEDVLIIVHSLFNELLLFLNLFYEQCF